MQNLTCLKPKSGWLDGPHFLSSFFIIIIIMSIILSFTLFTNNSLAHQRQKTATLRWRSSL